MRACPEGPRPPADGNTGTQLVDYNTGPAPAIVTGIDSVVVVAEVAEVVVDAAVAAAAAGTVVAAAQNTMLAAKTLTVCWTWRPH